MKIFKIGLPGKKASLNLSINAIVIVVLAMTLLGLGLGFIRGMFKDISQTTGEVTEQVREQILEDLRTGNKKLSFPSTEVDLELNSAKVVAMGVKNTKANQDLTFSINASILEGQPSGGGAASGDEVDFFYDSTEKTLQVTESEVYSLRIKSTGTAGVYMVKISITDEDEGNTYAEKTFFLNVY